MNARALVLPAVFGALFGLAVVAQHEAPRVRVAVPPAQAAAVFPEAPTLEWLSLGNRAVTADLLWILGIQLYGEATETRFREGISPLYPIYLDRLTALDPSFRFAFRFGVLTLPDGWYVEDAEALAERALETDPTDHQTPANLAYGFFISLALHEKSAEWFLRAAEVPGAPEGRYRRAAAQFAAFGSDADRAEQIYRDLAEDCGREGREAEFNCERAERGLQQVANMRFLEAAVREYERRFGELPERLAQVVEVGLIPALPLDPLNLNYFLRPDGTVAVSRAPRE
jgi:tetratricopeptide (TPR) repeat protein